METTFWIPKEELQGLLNAKVTVVEKRLAAMNKRTLHEHERDVNRTLYKWLEWADAFKVALEYNATKTIPITFSDFNKIISA